MKHDRKKTEPPIILQQLKHPILNAPKLAIDPLFELDLTREEVIWLINSMDRTDAQDCYRPFCSALAHLLKLEAGICDRLNIEVTLS